MSDYSVTVLLCEGRVYLLEGKDGGPKVHSHGIAYWDRPACNGMDDAISIALEHGFESDAVRAGYTLKDAEMFQLGLNGAWLVNFDRTP